MNTRTLKNAINEMGTYLLSVKMREQTSTADELVAEIAVAKLVGTTFTDFQKQALEDEILKRRRNEVSRNESLADPALERLSSSSSERSECLEVDRP